MDSRKMEETRRVRLALRLLLALEANVVAVSRPYAQRS